MIYIVSCFLLLCSVIVLLLPKKGAIKIVQKKETQKREPVKKHKITIEGYGFEFYDLRKMINTLTESKCNVCPLSSKGLCDQLPDPRDIHNRKSRFPIFCSSPSSPIGKPLSRHEMMIIDSCIPTLPSIRKYSMDAEVIYETEKRKAEIQTIYWGGKTYKFGKGDCSTCTFSKQMEDPRWPGYKANRYSEVQFPNICTFCRCPELGVERKTEEILRIYREGKNDPYPLVLKEVYDVIASPLL